MANIRSHSKTGLYEYRRAVTADIRSSLGSVSGFPDKPGRTALTKSLGTKSKAEANRLAASINLDVEAAFAKARKPNLTRSTRPALQSFEGREDEWPAAILVAFDRWLEAETKAVRQRLIRGDTSLGAFAHVSHVIDGHYRLQQFSAAHRLSAEANLWREIPDFDTLLAEAVQSQGVPIPIGHLLMDAFRTEFAERWLVLLKRIERFEQSPSALIAPHAEPKSEPETKPTKPTQSEAKTIFSANIDGWKSASILKLRQLDEYTRTILDFALFEGGVYLESIEAPTVQRWIESVRKGGLSVPTVRKKIAALKDYWHYVGSHNPALSAREPFKKLYLKSNKGKGDKDADIGDEKKRAAWTSSEVCDLWQAARSRGQRTLADAIRLAAFSGARIESLFKLRADNVLTKDGVFCFHIAWDKTHAGKRDVPIHPSLRKLFERLLRESVKRDGYLLPSTAENKYGERSVPVGKQFGRLKDSLGFGNEYVFHSIRKTVAAMFQEAGVLEGIAADVVGHAKPTMTYGLYAGRVKLEVQYEAMVKALKYPLAEFMSDL